MESKPLIVAIKYNSFSGHFFIDFSDENGYIVSCKVSEGVANGLARNLGLKVMEG